MGSGDGRTTAALRRTWRVRGIAATLCVICMMATSAATASANSPLTWSTATAIDAPNILYAVSCPSSSLCVAVDGAGNVVTSTQPNGGVWTVTHVEGANAFALNAISCPSASLCVAGDDHGTIVSSTNPTGGSGAWTPTPVGTAAQAISCPSSSLCVAVDATGNVLTSSDPGNPAPTWSSPASIDTNGLSGLSCPTTTFCLATDSAGNVLTSTDPTGGTAAWSPANVDGTFGLFGVSCPSTSLCVAVDDQGNVVTSANPGAGVPVWTVTDVDGTNAMYGVSCPSASLCVASDFVGNVVTSTNPTGGSGAWSATNVDGTSALYGISCPSTTSCVATDSAGNALSGTASGGSVTLTIKISGDGTGFVEPGSSFTCYHLNPGSPPTTCTTTWSYGAVVTIHATPTSTSTFGGWFGGCFFATGDCTVTLTGNLTVNAFFHRPQPLTVNIAGSATGKVYDTSGHTCHKTVPSARSATCRQSYAYGTLVKLKAAPTFGSRFMGWSGACRGTGVCSLYMFGSRAVTATFSHDAGVHVNGIEITQGVQTPELPTRSATNPSAVRVSYSGVQLPWSNGVPVTVELAQDHATVVRVYVNTALPRNGQPLPTMVLRAYRDGKMLDPGPIGPDQVPPGTAVPVGPLGFVSSVYNSFGRTPQRYDPNGAYTFTLPWGWAEGDVDFVADTNPAPSAFPACSAACQKRGIVLQGIHFNAVTAAFLDPIAFTVNNGFGAVGPRGYPSPDPQWAKVQAVVPFPIYVPPYKVPYDATTTLQGCSGVVQGTQTNGQFAAAVYAARNAALLKLVTDWADNNDTLSSHYPYGVVPAGVGNTCPNADGYSGGLTSAGTLYGSKQPRSVATDDRPVTGMAHEFHHGLGLVHAGVECGSGQDGSADAGSLDEGDDALKQTGESWPPSFTASTGAPADGAFDGVGLLGTEDPANSPYTISWNPSLPTPSAFSEVYDLMSYCTGGSEQSGWISVRNWNRDVEFRAPGPTSARDAASVPPYRTNPPATASAARTYAVTDVYDIASGRTLAMGVAPDASGPTASHPGDTYSLSARDATGHVVASGGAIATLVHVDHAASQMVVVGKVKTTGVREIDVLQDGHQISADIATAHAPTVKIVSPNAQSRVGGRGDVLLRWRSHDTDSSSLSVIVRYTADGGRTWRTIYGGVDRGVARVPGYLLSASGDAQVRLYVSDGFNEAIATSGRFTSLGAPPVVSIMSPRKGARFLAGTALNLAGSAYDDAGHRLSGRSLLWHVGRSVLAHGAQITTIGLTAGRHAIELTARDRHGRTQSASILITILPAPPVLIALNAPHRISPTARSVTLRLATLAPATLTIGHLHAPISRRRRSVRVSIRPGHKTLTLVMVLRSGSYRARIKETIMR